MGWEDMLPNFAIQIEYGTVTGRFGSQDEFCYRCEYRFRESALPRRISYQGVTVFIETLVIIFWILAVNV
jgi:hypothetical protein